ncbi:zinc finger protein 281 isoform X1 [Puma concolor]|uniref:Zinc finger protein 281 n=2 Tax=Felidae TaxID=9681 RepID=A0A6P6HMD6_PUMCO|nr:zinc finger protein 281 isoform X1 [Puma concolor]
MGYTTQRAAAPGLHAVSFFSSLQPPSHAAVRSRVIPPFGFHPLSVLPQKPSPTSNSVSAAHQSRPFAWKPLSTGDPNPRPSSPGPPLRPTAPVIDRQTGRKLQRRRRGSAELPSGWVEEFPADTAPRLRSTGEAFNSIVERTALFLLTGGDGGCGGGGTRLLRGMKIGSGFLSGGGGTGSSGGSGSGGGGSSGGGSGGSGSSRRAEMEPTFPQGMVMFNHRLPPVTSFTRPAGSAAPPPQCVLSSSTSAAPAAEPPPPPAPDMTFKKEPAASAAAFPSQRTSWGFLQSLVSIKQEKPADPEEQQSHHHHHHHHYGGLFAGAEERSPGLGGGDGGSHGVIQDLSILHQHAQQQPAQHHRDVLLSSSSRTDDHHGSEEPKQDTNVKKAKRPKPESQGIKAKRKPSASSKPSLVGDGEGAILSPSQKPHICDHCSAAFRSSYHLRRHVLIHTGERPFQCSQCSMGFIQKYLLQRHEKIHSREKPFGCDQCSMKFIQKYHMERHKRTHSGEKPYKCDTCQQYFSRTDRLLKHRRTCGEAIAKGAAGAEPGSSTHSSMGNLAVLSQGNTSSSRRKTKSKSIAVENKEHKTGKTSESQISNNINMQSYSVEMPTVSSSGGIIGTGIDELQKRVPKLIFKKGSRKNTEKSYLNFVSPLPDIIGQKSLSGKPGGSLGIVSNNSVETISLLQSTSGKQGQISSNYDDAMQFSKKRRYLPTASSNSAFSINVGHMVSQQSVIQSAGVSVLDNETPLSLIDSSALNAEIKSCHDKSGIPDEVLQSILDQYSNKSESQKEDPFNITEPRVDLHTSGEHSELVQEENLSPGTQTSSSDKASMLQEYSKYLQQAFEKSTNAGFTLGHGFQFVSLSSPLHNHTLFPEKQIYTTSPLECGFGQSVTSVLPSSLPKPPFGMLFGSQPGLYLSALDATHQQLTPSQELDDLIDSQKNLETSSAFQSSSQKLTSQKEQQKNLESSTSFQIPSQELASQIDPQKDIEPRTTYQIENFAQAFGSQFKSGSRVPMTFITNSNGEVDHRVRTSVSDFSGYTNMMSDVSEPCSTRVKTPTSQSYR